MSVWAVEPMKEEDVSPVAALDDAAFGTHGPSDTQEAREKNLHEELKRTWARLRVVRDVGGRVVGYVLFWHVTDEIHLLNVAVDPRARRQRVGRTLVEAVIEYARANQAAKVLLEVRASNAPAIALYENLGFVRFNVRARYYPDGEDGVEMMLTIA
jgi:ribosomal-protein-alanine N-acetyltransferase